MKRIQPSHDAPDWDAKATEALERARLMPPGQEKTEALKKAGMLQCRRHTRAFLCEAWQAANKVEPLQLAAPLVFLGGCFWASYF
jgi:hypothetical protein